MFANWSPNCRNYYVNKDEKFRIFKNLYNEKSITLDIYLNHIVELYTFDKKKVETVADLTDSDSAESDNSDNDSIDDQDEHVVVEQISHLEINNQQISQINSEQISIGSQDFLFDYNSNDILTYFNL